MDSVPERWILSHSFCEDNLIETLPESEVRSLRDVIAGTGRPLTLISKDFKGLHAASQSLEARIRYSKLREFQSNHDGDIIWPLFYILLAECHYFLFDNYGSYLHAKRALELLRRTGTHPEDSVLLQAVSYLDVLGKPKPDCWDEEEEGITVVEYKRPFNIRDREFNMSTASLSPVALGKLEVLRTSDADFTEFARLACVTSNELEAVFALTGDSVTHLVKRGFVDNAIQGISRQSRIQRKQQVIQVLENSMACFSAILPFAKETIETASFSFTEQTLKDLHSTLLKEDNVDSEEYEDGEKQYILVPAGEYRRTPCYASHESKGYVTHFCPAADLEQEMAWFLSMLEVVLSNPSGSPFYDCAWLQCAFVTIHPFADGNGRVSRILSSIPLRRAMLPPVVVTSEHKEEYFATLHEARNTGSVQALARFLQDEMTHSIDRLLGLQGWRVQSTTGVRAVNVSRLRDYKQNVRVIGRHY